jgi:hypothetical protein
LADFYRQAYDGSWELQIADTRPQTASSQTASSQTANPQNTAVQIESNQGHQPSATGAAMGVSHAAAPQASIQPLPAPAVTAKDQPVAAISNSGGGAGSLTAAVPTSIGAHDSDAINQNLAGLAAGRITLSSH